MQVQILPGVPLSRSCSACPRTRYRIGVLTGQASRRRLLSVWFPFGMGCKSSVLRQFQCERLRSPTGEAIGSDPVQCWFESNRRYQLSTRPRSPIGRGTRLKIGQLPVRVRPWIPARSPRFESPVAETNVNLEPGTAPAWACARRAFRKREGAAEWPATGLENQGGYCVPGVRFLHLPPTFFNQRGL